jgi:uncharacterized protein YjbI with pentapeptide repeats
MGKLHGSVTMTVEETTRERFETRDEFAEAFRVQRNIVAADVTGVDLVGITIAAGNLAEVDFSNSDLTGAKLAGLNMEHAKMQGANLTGAKVAGVNLESADFKEANLTDSTWAGVNVAGADFSGADMTGASSMGVDWDSASVPPDPIPEAKNIDKRLFVAPVAVFVALIGIVLVLRQLKK